MAEMIGIKPEPHCAYCGKHMTLLFANPEYNWQILWACKDCNCKAYLNASQYWFESLESEKIILPEIQEPLDRTSLVRTYYGSLYYYPAAYQISRALHASLPYTLTLKQWEETIKHFDKRCAYCYGHFELFTFEHYYPHSTGYGFTQNNIIPACAHCNLSRKDSDIIEWLIDCMGIVPQSAYSRKDKIENWFAQLIA